MRVKAKYDGRKIDALIKKAKGTVVKVGVLRGTGEHPYAKNGQTVALIAAWNEFGTSTGIPSRPFLRTTMREHNYYRAELKRIMEFVLKGAMPMPLFKQLGIRAAADMQNKIADNDFQRNAPSTIARKSTSSGVHDKPLIDSGHLRQSIQSSVEVSR